jgi:hypothetical protein
LKSGWWRDSLRGFSELDKLRLVLVDGHDEFSEVLMTTNAAEAFLRYVLRTLLPP